MTNQSGKPLLEVHNLKTYFFTDDGVVKAVDGVDFYVNPGEVLGLVGESGCGKSVTSLSIMRLVGSPGKVVDGKIIFEDKELLEMSEAEMIHMRGNRMSMIFQQPQSSLNPVFKVGEQVAEVLRIHQKMDKSQAWRRAIDLLQLVGIPDAEKKAHAYPHEMSGGQAQRVMIAMALALNPQLLIAEMADRVAVMYAGRIVEQAGVRNLFSIPLHPYTQGLIDSIPVLGQVKDRLDVIPGNVPNLIDLPLGCRFASRCRSREQFELEICSQVEPELLPAQTDHLVRCWLYHDRRESGYQAPLKATLETEKQ